MRRWLCSDDCSACLVAAQLAAAPAPAANLAVTVADRAGRPVEHAVVYAVSPAAEAQPAKGRSAIVNQLDREFVPFVTAVQAGTVVQSLTVNADRRFLASFTLELNVPRRKRKPPPEKDSY